MSRAVYAVGAAGVLLMISLSFGTSPLYSQSDAAATFKSKCAV